LSQAVVFGKTGATLEVEDALSVAGNRPGRRAGDLVLPRVRQVVGLKLPP